MIPWLSLRVDNSTFPESGEPPSVDWPSLARRWNLPTPTSSDDRNEGDQVGLLALYRKGQPLPYLFLSARDGGGTITTPGNPLDPPRLWAITHRPLARLLGTMEFSGVLSVWLDVLPEGRIGLAGISSELDAPEVIGAIELMRAGVASVLDAMHGAGAWWALEEPHGLACIVPVEHDSRVGEVAISEEALLQIPPWLWLDNVSLELLSTGLVRSSEGPVGYVSSRTRHSKSLPDCAGEAVARARRVLPGGAPPKLAFSEASRVLGRLQRRRFL